jgi:predicted GNAT family acetyltransferase
MDENEIPAAGALRVTRDDDGSRYTGHLDGELASVLDFSRRGDVLAFTHTGTEPRFRGRGLAGEITRQALEDVRANGLTVRPVCSFTVAYFAEHPEVADLRA